MTTTSAPSRRQFLRAGSALFALGCVALLFLPVAQAADPVAVFADKVRPMLAAYCDRCHGTEKPKGDLTLAGPRDAAKLAADGDLWFRVLAQVEAGSMPPEGKPRLTAAEQKSLSDWVRGDLTELLAAKRLLEGRSPIRRFSRNEYANTLQDLFGVRPLVHLHLPEDGRVDGYDRVGAALPLSAEGAFGYYAMADDLLHRWVLKPLPKDYDATPAGRAVRADAMESGESPGHTLVLPDGWMVSYNSDVTSGRLKYPGVKYPGVHKVRMHVYGYQTDKPMPFGLYVGNTGAYPQMLDQVGIFEAQPGKPAVVETELYLRNGIGMRLIPLGLGVPVPKNTQAKNYKGAGLAVQWVEVVEPELPLAGDRWLTADFPPALQQELRSSKKVYLPKVAAKNTTVAKSVTRDEFISLMKKTFARVGGQLFRRDLSDAEVDKLVANVAGQIDGGGALDAAFLEAVAELMTTPDFLCVVEKPGRLTDFALASRLSYLLWNSTPDEPLLAAARDKTLGDPKVLREQTERMLRDPKAGRFVADFTDQWLGLRMIDDTTPDAALYPEYRRNDLLKPSSVRETRAFFQTLVDENLGTRHLVDSPWALVNAPLAKHYGIDGVTGLELRKVPLPAGSPFGGLWTQSAVLKVTANGNNTSPVKRGVWVAERLLGTPIPPPPPNVGAVDPDVRGAKTLREQLALHSQGGSCMACHARFDPYGFALESFDVTGAYRTHYRMPDLEVAKLPPAERKGKALWKAGLVVDPSGVTPDGKAFADVGALRARLAGDPERLARGLVRHLLTYATGTPTSELDGPAVGRMVAEAGPEYGVRSLVHAVVQSETFRVK